MRGEKPAEKDRLAVYNTGIEALAAGAIVLVIGVMFHSLAGDIALRISGITDMSYLIQHVSWIFWVAPICYPVSALILGAGTFLLYRAYRQTHPRDRKQTRLIAHW